MEEIAFESYVFASLPQGACRLRLRAGMVYAPDDRAFAQLGAQYPGNFLTGAGYFGIGLPDCIQHGKRVGEQAVDFLQKR